MESESLVKRDKRIEINRPVYKQKEFDQEFSITNKSEPENNLLKKTLKNIAIKFYPNNILGIFTILNLITEYDYKKNLISDLLSGFTVGVMHIPAGLKNIFKI